MAPKREAPPGKAPEKSGAQKRRERREREEAAADAEHPSDPNQNDAWCEAYEQIGEPPADVVGRVEWAQRMLAQALYETATDPNTPARERRRVIGDLGAKVGLTAVRALYEERLKKLEGRVYGGREGKDADASDGLEELDPAS